MSRDELYRFYLSCHFSEDFALRMVMKAEDFAKQQSIAFMQWNSPMYTVGIDRQADQWFDHKGECVAQSTEELYNQFIEQQNK